MEKQDLHIHTSYSSDSDALMSESVCIAVKKGLKKIAFTEHMDLDYPSYAKTVFISEMSEDSLKMHPDLDKLPLFTFDPEKYMKELNELKGKYCNEITIMSGMEMGLRAGRHDLVKEYTRLRKEYPFEFCIGSVHLIDDMDPYYVAFWENKDPDTVVEEYFKILKECVREYEGIDSLGHIDYVLRYVPEASIDISKELYFKDTYRRNKRLIDEILSTIIERNIALEINTKGKFSDIKHVHPSDEIKDRYIAMGGKRFTVGSDAHYSNDVGEGTDGI